MKYRITATVEVANAALAARVEKALARDRRLVVSVERVLELVSRTNLMTGAPYLEERDTPLYLSPASESYWSM